MHVSFSSYRHRGHCRDTEDFLSLCLSLKGIARTSTSTSEEGGEEEEDDANEGSSGDGDLEPPAPTTVRAPVPTLRTGVRPKFRV